MVTIYSFKFPASKFAVTIKRNWDLGLDSVFPAVRLERVRNKRVCRREAAIRYHAKARHELVQALALVIDGKVAPGFMNSRTNWVNEASRLLRATPYR